MAAFASFPCHLCAYGPHTGLFYHMVFQRNCARDRKRRIINYFLERNFTKLLTKKNMTNWSQLSKILQKVSFSGKIGTFQQRRPLDDYRISDLPY